MTTVIEGKKHTESETKKILHPLVREWFFSKFEKFSMTQLYGVYEIWHRNNILISAPTGGTKTLTAFLSILNYLVGLAEKNKLEEKVYAVYTSPLKALSNDIHKNLVEPLNEIREIAEIVGGDKTYSHFVRRINKEFDLSDEERNSQVFVLYALDGEKKVGFCVVGFSPAKMGVWNSVFKEEGWVNKDFKMERDPYELMYMYVRPEYRGQGFGKTLFKKAMEFTKENDIKGVYAYVSDKTDTAMGFYKQMEGKIIQDFSKETS